MNVRFEPNPNFEPEMKRHLARILQRVLDEVGRTHARGDETEIRIALTAVAARHGVHKWIPSDDAVKAIAEGRPVVAR